MQTVELKVGMSCQGCVGAVKRVLGKMEGIYNSLVIDIPFFFLCLTYATEIDTPVYQQPV
jgi:copper chaperone CopZ